MVDNLILGLTAALQLKQFMFMVLGTVIGLWVGVLPGLGGPVAMAILIPFTFSMDPLSALLTIAILALIGPYLLNVDLPHGLVGDWLIDKLALRAS